MQKARLSSATFFRQQFGLADRRTAHSGSAKKMIVDRGSRSCTAIQAVVAVSTRLSAVVSHAEQNLKVPFGLIC